MAGVDAWERAGILFERYDYDRGPKATLPLHVHEHHQWCLSLDFPGYYDYRGSRLTVPPMAVSVIHAGELHASGDPHDRDRPASFLLANLPVDVYDGAASSLSGRTRPGPFLRVAVTTAAPVSRAFTTFHRASRSPTDRLALDVALLALVEAASAVQADADLVAPPGGREVRAVQVARDYLHAHVAAPVALADLTRVGGVSERHLLREFKRLTGLPPHRYQLQLRVDEAKRRLAAGGGVAEVASAVGFVDQSHLTRHFRRHVGFTPGRYRSVERPR